jgi:FkbM family methyltransferase
MQEPGSTGDASRHRKSGVSGFSPLRSARRSLRRCLAHLQSAAYPMLLWLSRGARRHRVFRSRTLRRLRFDASEPGALLVSRGISETFVVSASDRIIGRAVYVDRVPFDFHKLENALRILGGNGARSVLFDIGANIGTICIPAVKRKLFKRAVAVEPDPQNYALLVANIHLNGLADRIVTHGVALGGSDNECLPLELSDNNFGHHRVSVGAGPDLRTRPGSKIIAVRSETFDTAIANIVPNDGVIWIDAEGSEGHILRGASGALRSRPPICLEFLPEEMSKARSYQALKEVLIGCGYNWYFDLEHGFPPRPLTAASLDELYDRLGERGAHTDLLVVALTRRN